MTGPTVCSSPPTSTPSTATGWQTIPVLPGVKQDLLLSLHQQLMDIYTKDGAQVKELYTGHNRIGMGGDYLTMWEQCLQKFVDFGGAALTDNRRGDGTLMAQDGN